MRSRPLFLCLLAASLWCGAVGNTQTLVHPTPKQQQMRQVGGLEEAKLITPNDGWARSAKQLMFTTDQGATWKEITPTGGGVDFTIAKVLFSDSDQGWVLHQKTINNGDSWDLLLSTTQDQGLTWKSKQASGIPAHDLELYGGNASISFVTPQQGWLELQTISSSNFSSGTLYMTTDGGASWQALPRTPIFGTIQFQQDGTDYITGGVAGDEIHKTGDGGRTWSALTLPPSIASSSGAGVLSAPQLAGRDILVTRSVGSGQSLTSQTLRSSDGGKSWNASESSPGRPKYKTKTAAAADGSTVEAVSTETSNLFLKVGQSSHTPVLPSSWSGSKIAVLGLSFPNSQSGWIEVGKTLCSGTGCVNGNYLLRTQDGGTTVQEANIPFSTSEAPLFPQSVLETPGTTNQSSQKAVPLATDTGIGLHGFDTYSAPSNALLEPRTKIYPYFHANGI